MPNEKLYTLNSDFDEGILNGVEHDTVPNQLQLSKINTSLPFIWVPNNNGTISKVDTNTGNELGRYIVWPSGSPNPSNSPSRTTVDLKGNCWVANRGLGTVVKTGQFETGEWEDRNGNGICDTSNDANADGNISTSEMLPWPDDECVLKEIILFGASPAAYTPGLYTGGYDGGIFPRALAVDKDNNIWAGTYYTKKYYKLNGDTGNIIATIDLSTYNHHPYGAVVDKYGYLWSVSGPEAPNHLLKIDTTTNNVVAIISLNFSCYGIALDYNDHIFVSGWTSQALARINIITDTLDWVKFDPNHLSSSRGVACTSDNNIWVANSGNNSVTRYDNNGNFIAQIDGGNVPTGLSVDSNGKVWACNLNDDYIYRINPATNAIDLSKAILGSGGHYSYSDMTGIVARTITTRLGTWTAIFDSEALDTPWGNVSWNSLEPTGTSITTKVRSSNDKTTWSPWESVVNGVNLSTTPNGRFLEIETTLKMDSGETSPILYDLLVKAQIQITRGIIF
ncbi:hypothetical protein JCM1393_07560 [Clostridium carnis]